MSRDNLTVYMYRSFVILFHWLMICFSTGTSLTVTSGPCDQGYFCVSGVDRPNPVMIDNTQCPTGTVHPIIGDICPMGHFCVEGAAFPEACPAGTYQDSTTQWYDY